MYYKTLIKVIMSVTLISVGCYQRELGDKLKALSQHILYADIIRIIVI